MIHCVRVDAIVLSNSTSTPFFTLPVERRTVVPSTSGHFKLSITRDGVGYNTSCISYGSSASSVSDALDYTDPVADLGGASVVRQGNGSSTYDYGYTYTISAANTTLSLGGSIDDIDVAGMGTSVGCSRVSTLGSWDEEANWDTGVVPGSADEAREVVDYEPSGIEILQSLAGLVRSITSEMKCIVYLRRSISVG